MSSKSYSSHIPFTSPHSTRPSDSPVSQYSNNSSSGGYTPLRYYDRTIPLPSTHESFQIHPLLVTRSALSGRLNMVTPLEQALTQPACITPQVLSQNATSPPRSHIRIHLSELQLTINVGASSQSSYVTVYDIIRSIHEQLMRHIPSHLSPLVHLASAAHRARCAQYRSTTQASELAKGPRFVDVYQGRFMWSGLVISDLTPEAEILTVQLC